ncbi:MAG: efflux RND transporter periplasmic adaptor subunit [Flavobacteriales bacterium]|nr:efflux RND transporter periplasmic adaptor subunit [Flavobacteriales bacterium]
MKILRSLLILVFTPQLLSSCGDERKGVMPNKQSVTFSIYASVTVEPANLYTAYPQLPGIISEVFVSEGDTVYAGQKIGSIINSGMEVNQEKAKLQYQLAESKLFGSGNTLKNIESEIDILKAQVKFDSSNYFKNKKLLEQNVVSETSVDNLKLKYDLSQKQLSSALQKYIQLKEELESGLKISEANLKVANINLDDSYIYSFIDGMVYNVQKETGEFISSQMPFAQIGSKDKFVLKMLVDEEDITQVKIGQHVIVSLESYPGEIFQCEVTKIYPLKDQVNQTFTVEGIFLETPPTLLYGMSGESNIIVEEIQDALVIPREFVNENNEVNTADGLVKVQTGLKDMEFIQITDGIDENTKIFPLHED